jgi:hypothetical protein
MNQLDNLVARLQEADAQLSSALDDRHHFDVWSQSRPRGASAKAPSKAEQAKDDAISRAEDRAHDSIARALIALCKFRPRTPGEFYRWLRVVFEHWRIEGAELSNERDRRCIAEMLASMNGSVISMVGRYDAAL